MISNADFSYCIEEAMACSADERHHWRKNQFILCFRRLPKPRTGPVVLKLMSKE